MPAAGPEAAPAWPEAEVPEAEEPEAEEPEAEEPEAQEAEAEVAAPAGTEVLGLRQRGLRKRLLRQECLRLRCLEPEVGPAVAAAGSQAGQPEAAETGCLAAAVAAAAEWSKAQVQAAGLLAKAQGVPTVEAQACEPWSAE